MLTNSVVNTALNNRHPLLFSFAKGASLGAPFFMGVKILLIILSTLLATGLHAEPLCSTSDYDQHVRIGRVVDGDTVSLENGVSVRLIGIDTPEIGRDGQAHELGALAAKHYLEDLLRQDVKYPIVYDVERHDHFGRSLAHLFLPAGENVQALLLKQGLGTSLTIPPNLGFLECYQQLSRQARTSQRGIWSLRQYQTIKVTELSGKERGYRIIEGQITDIGKSRSAIWLNLENNFAIRIKRNDLEYFRGLRFVDLKGTHIQVRGLLYKRNKQLRMRLRHNVDLRILTAP